MVNMTPWFSSRDSPYEVLRDMLAKSKRTTKAKYLGQNIYKEY